LEKEKKGSVPKDDSGKKTDWIEKASRETFKMLRKC